MSKEDEQFIGSMAAFIGARLHYPNPLVNGHGNPWVSTIKVDQHKEKFWQIRVYCTLADDALVKQKWAWLKDRQRRIEAGEQVYRARTKPEDIMAEEPTDEFRARCLKSDAIHYRETYLDMVALRPSAIGRICGSADHTELLYPAIPELEARLDELSARSSEWTQWLIEKYGVPDLTGLKAYLKGVYEPSWRDRSALSD